MKVAIVIPVYRNQFSFLEKCSLRQCLKVFSKYPVLFLIPECLAIENDLCCDHVQYARVPSEWMGTWQAYSKMLCTIGFYELFREYDYILIYQLDAFVFEDRLSYFCNLGFDYYGAPWLDGIDIGGRKVTVGNGGFSLRKVKACMEVLHKRTYTGGEEDACFWADCLSYGLKIAPMDVALDFAFETNVRRCFLMNNSRLPFGCHAWEKWDFSFWKPYFEREGFSIGLQEEVHEISFVHWICWRLGEKELLDCTGFDRQRGEKIYVWGTKAEGFECGYFLNRIGLDYEYIDTDRHTWGNKLWGKTVNPPDMLIGIREGCLVVIAARDHETAIREKMKEMETENRIEKFSEIEKKIMRHIQKDRFGKMSQ